MKIAAVQFNAIFADVKANLLQANEYIKEAALKGAELILFPEFFTSAAGFSDKMLDVAWQNNQVVKKLKKWSEEYNIIIGGSYITFDGQNAYNLFQLVFPNGEIYEHKKDIPTQFENCYYANGDTNNVLHTPIGNIGVALCWEMIRYETVERLANKTDVILSGSCWWDLPQDAPLEREPLRQYNQRLALETPVSLAKILNVPLVHASHCGTVTALNFPNADRIQTRQLVGAAQIIDANGNIIERRCFNEGGGMVISDISWDKTNPNNVVNKKHPENYWIPDLPDSYINAWETINPKGKEYYNNIALPYYKGL